MDLQKISEQSFIDELEKIVKEAGFVAPIRGLLKKTKFPRSFETPIHETAHNIIDKDKEE